MADFQKVKFQTNIAKVLKFPYGDFKEKAGAIWEGKQLPVSFQYSVEEGGEKKVLFATEYLHKELQRVGVSAGSELEITLAEDSQDKKKKVWLINGGQTAQKESPEAPSGLGWPSPEPPLGDNEAPIDEGPYHVGPPITPSTQAPQPAVVPPMVEIGATYLACLRMAQAFLGVESTDIQAATATMFIAADRNIKVRATPKMVEAFREAMRDG